MQKITTIMLFMFGLSMMSFSSNPSLEKLDLPIKYPLVTIFCEDGSTGEYYLLPDYDDEDIVDIETALCSD